LSSNLFFNAISAGATAQTVTCGGSDAFVGSLGVIGTTVDYDAFASVTGTVITLNAGTTGGFARGSQITLVALAANLWSVNGVLVGDGTPDYAVLLIFWGLRPPINSLGD
jgi:hypothetical protein